MAEPDPFLDEAVRRGLIAPAQAEDCRRLDRALREVQVELSIEEIAARKGFLTPEQSAEIRRALARLRVGRYEVIERLGEGAAGIVWKARDTKLDRVVALKLLSQKAQVSQSFRERFLREARIAVTLNHVSIVRGLDYGEADGYQFFAMEFVDGEDAESRLQRLGRFPEKDAVAIALDVARALEYVQRFSIVHRDIKPGNLLLTPSGHVKVCDLGLAKPILAEKELLEGDGTTAGTPYYMSPEQIREPDSIDWRSDVYSLGATLYHLLTGVPVFRPDGQSSVIQRHLRERPRNPREHVLELSDGAAAVVMRMLQKSREDRYGSLAELISDLEAVLEGRQPQHTAPPVPPETATAERHARHAVARRITERTNPREHPFPWTTAAIVGLLLAAVGVAAVRSAMTKPTEPPAVPPPIASEPPPAAPPDSPPPPSPAPSVPAPAPEPPPKERDLLAEREAKEALDRLVEELVPAQVADGHFRTALQMLDGFAEKHAGTAAAGKVPEAKGKVDAIARGRFDEVLAHARDFVRRHRFDDARARVEEAARFDIEWAAEAAAKARDEVDRAAVEFERAREAQAGAFSDLFGRAVLEAGRAGVPAAREIVESGGAAVPAWDDEVGELREELDLLATIGLDPDVPDTSTPRGAMAVMLAFLAHGEVDRADEALLAVGSAGGDTDRARSKIAAARGVLAREARSLADAGRRELEAGRVDAAAAAATEARRRLPSSADAILLAARVHMVRGEFDEASLLLGGLLSRPDAPAEARFRAGQLTARLDEDLGRASAEIEQAMREAGEDEPWLPEARTALAAVRERRLEGDVKDWREVAKGARTRTKRDAAEGALGRILGVLPDDADALLALGQLYAETKRSTPAAILLSRVARLDAATELQRRRAADLLAPLKAAGVAASVEDGRDLASIALRYARNEGWPQVVRHCNLALALSPHLEETRVLLVRAHLALAREPNADAENSRAALENAETLVRLYPDEARPLALRADALLLSGEAARALNDAATAAIVDPRSAAAQAALARARVATGDAKGAVDAATAAVGIEPSAENFLALAAAYLAASDRERARGVLENYQHRFGRDDAWRALQSRVDED